MATGLAPPFLGIGNATQALTSPQQSPSIALHADAAAHRP